MTKPARAKLTLRSRPANDDATSPAQETVSTAAATKQTDEAAVAPVQTTPAGDEIELDLTIGQISFGSTKTGAPYATLRNEGRRTIMAFGEIADAIRGLDRVSCIVAGGRSTDKIVAVRLPGANDLLVETPRAA